MAFQCCPAAFVTSRPSRPIWITKKKQKQAVKFLARFQLILRRKFCLFKIIAAIFLFGDFHFQLRMNESVLGGNSSKDNCHRHVDPHDLQIIFFSDKKTERRQSEQETAVSDWPSSSQTKIFFGSFSWVIQVSSSSVRLSLDIIFNCEWKFQILRDIWINTRLADLNVTWFESRPIQTLRRHFEF